LFEGNAFERMKGCLETTWLSGSSSLLQNERKSGSLINLPSLFPKTTSPFLSARFSKTTALCKTYTLCLLK